MKNKIVVVLISFLMHHGFGQENESYSKLLKEAWDLYQSREFYTSGQKYTEAFAVLDNQSNMSNKEVSNRFNAACAWALAKESDAAFVQLFKIAKEGKFSNYKQLTNDGDLKSLYTDPRWKKVTEIVAAEYEKIKPLSKEELKSIFEKYKDAHQKVFKKGSTVADVDFLYRFYTSDFEYNHPGYGDIYSRELLYNNTVKYLKKGRYNDFPKSKIVNMIIGLNAIVIEELQENKTESKMTLIKFRKDKIYYIEEYW
ncbi:hypothetical protein [Aquimarina macrocephali]|uniref:hypothetical protein n=1 Tax=Aquimarina macrocephali TaxID=666563 RepID=UPI003F67BDF4